jgi:GT2 family glycosyltransferase
MKVFVVVVTFNGAPWIRGALDSLRASETPCVAVVVDNASGDGTADIVRQEYPEAVLIARQDNTGFGRGNNIGIRHALDSGADYIFLLNQDAFVTPDALGLLADFLEQHPGYAIATPLHCSPDLGALDPQTQRGYLQRYAPQYLSDACLGRVQPYYPIRGINAAAWMVRADAFARVGGFDPLFFMYGEDDDMITRFHHHGQGFALVPASRIVHLRARSASAALPLGKRLWRLSERERSQLLIDLKQLDGRLAGKLLRLVSGGLVLPLAHFLNNYDWQALLASYLATLRVLVELPAIVRHTALCRQPGAHFIE